MRKELRVLTQVIKEQGRKLEQLLVAQQVIPEEALHFMEQIVSEEEMVGFECTLYDTG